MTAFTQVASEEWPNGRTRLVAIVALSPSELQASRGLEFDSGSDDFDAFELAVLELPSGTTVSLMRYSCGPAAATDVYGYLECDIDEVVDELVAALGLTADAISWRAADSPSP